MIGWATTIDEAIGLLRKLKMAGVEKVALPSERCGFVTDLVQMELVYVDKKTLKIVGDEANNYKQTEDNTSVALFS
jgi:hypothetical protein